ncbi:HmuY family protein [Pedobacter sp. MC2016-14]|uniref:HmuY family protein n=1 Tax=Pedobacter sp. MC2016-14 TaxID=2897327 RepID=UPI001E5C6A90|nr:HmuY family protein [Pedobacter sp. MC2016-14]MCD0490513.1 HmuY family protein [Pedobacter sp. MC2016-14]
MMTINDKNGWFNYPVWLLFLALALSSCSKSEDAVPEPEVETFKTEAPWVPARAKLLKEWSYNYEKVIPVAGIYSKENFETKQGKAYVFLDEKYSVVYVVDWPAGATHGSLFADPVYFNLDTRDTVPRLQVLAGTNDNWHINFNDIYNSTISVNSDNSSFESGMIRTIATPFDELDQVPAIPAGLGKIVDMTVAIDNAAGNSWGYYTMANHILNPFRNKTNIIYLKDGRRVKFQLQNLYYGNPAPGTVKDKYEYPAPYFNFKYYIQPVAGNNTIKTRG